MEDADLVNRFTYHPPSTDQVEVYEEVRDRALRLSLYLNTVCPDSREKSSAISYLEMAVFWANASIARHGDEPPNQAL